MKRLLAVLSFSLVGFAEAQDANLKGADLCLNYVASDPLLGGDIESRIQRKMAAYRIPLPTCGQQRHRVTLTLDVVSREWVPVYVAELNVYDSRSAYPLPPSIYRRQTFSWASTENAPAKITQDMLDLVEQMAADYATANP